MSAQEHAAIVRDRMGVCLALHGYRGYSEDCPACVSHRKGEAALEALVADNERLTVERDEARREAETYYKRWEAEVDAVTQEVGRAEAAEGELADEQGKSRASWRSAIQAQDRAEAAEAEVERLTAERDALLTERASAHMYFDQIESRAESAEAEVERLTAKLQTFSPSWGSLAPEQEQR